MKRAGREPGSPTLLSPGSFISDEAARTFKEPPVSSSPRPGVKPPPGAKKRWRSKMAQQSPAWRNLARRLHRRRAGVRLADRILPEGLVLADLGEGLELVDKASGAVVDPPELLSDEKGGSDRLEVMRTRAGALLALGSTRENHWVAKREGMEPEPWDASGALWKPSLRVNQDYAEDLRLRARKVIRYCLARFAREAPSRIRACMALRGGSAKLGWKLVTLSGGKPRPGRSQVQELERWGLAFRQLTNRRGGGGWWDTVEAGFKGVEDAGVEHSYVHAHLLVLCPYTDKAALEAEWQRCIVWADRKLGLDPAQDEEAPPFVDIRDIQRRKNRETGAWESVALDHAINEVCKYITKGDAIAKMPLERVLDMVMVERWPRLFEVFGCLREYRRDLRSESPTAEDTAKLVLDAETAAALGPAVLQCGLRELRQAKPRHEVQAVLNGRAWRWSTAPRGAARPQAASRHDTKRIFAGDLDSVTAARLVTRAWEDAGLLAEERILEWQTLRKRPRPPSWREAMWTHSWSSWVALVTGRAKRCQRFREEILKKSTCPGSFTTLD